MYWLALFGAIICNIIANVAFKHAVTRTPLDEGITSILKLAADPWMWIGGVFCIFLLGCYLYALKGLDISVAYPAITGIALLGVVLSGTLFFDEAISLSRALGIISVVVGVLLLKESG